MTFWDHAEQLRGTLLRIAAIIFVLGVVLFALMDNIYDSVILAPCRSDFPLYQLLDWIERTSGVVEFPSGSHQFHVDLINTELASQFFLHVSTSGWLALVLAFPFVIYQLWRFVSPGLYPKERRNAGSAFFWGCLMFYLGVAVGYFLVFPLTLRFLATYQLSEMIPNIITIDSYMDNFIVLTLAMGITFELPLLAWLLGRIGVLKRAFFERYRRHAIVVLLIVAALITPTGDPFTLLVVFLPIYLLWECSARLVPPAEPDSIDEDVA